MYSVQYEPGYVGGWIESCSYFKSVTESTEGSLQSEGDIVSAMELDAILTGDCTVEVGVRRRAKAPTLAHQSVTLRTQQHK